MKEAINSTKLTDIIFGTRDFPNGKKCEIQNCNECFSNRDLEIHIHNVFAIFVPFGIIPMISFVVYLKSKSNVE
uniref:Uncharacterized protein n=1 Tax=Romanomermis culicivorax TaxID=13658 RepID=A0A915JT14_ROMCU